MMSKNNFVIARKALKELNGALSELFGQLADSITMPIEHMLDVEEQKPVQAATTFEEKKANAEDIQKRAVETAKAKSEERKLRQEEFKKHGLKIFDEAPKDEAPEDDAPEDDALNTDDLNTEALKDDALKTEAPKTEAPKVEALKAKAPKAKAEKKVETPKTTESAQEALV